MISGSVCSGPRHLRRSQRQCGLCVVRDHRLGIAAVDDRRGPNNCGRCRALECDVARADNRWRSGIGADDVTPAFDPGAVRATFADSRPSGANTDRLFIPLTHTEALVDDTVTIVIGAIADLDPLRMNRRSTVVAVSVVVHIALGPTAGFGDLIGVAEPVSIPVPEEK